MSQNIFKYPDTNSSRAETDYLNRKFHGLNIAIVGLGGTGSYILDLVSKTPVQSIHLYDGDSYQLHNAFRAPGAINGCILDQEESIFKANYFAAIYSNMHNGIIPHNEFITKENIDDLNKFDWVFLSVDKNSIRSMIANHLASKRVNFIDVGMGIHKGEDMLFGSMRVTTVPSGYNNSISKRIGSEETDQNDYTPNIQMADLNCLNAAFAVIKWKKCVGFYRDLKNEHHSLYFTDTAKLINDDFTP